MIKSKTVDYDAFIRYEYNNSVYWFLVNKSSIEDIHPNTIIELKNAIFFEDVFS
jgi:hypothetical protein